jgi:hypothetical protein
MSDFHDDDPDYDDEPETPQPQQRRQPTEAEIRIWRKNARKWEQAEPELTKLQRENLLLRTPGLNDLTPTKMKALFSTHEGEFTPEALRATAEDLGFVQPPPPEVPDQEVQAHQRIAQASQGADTSTPDPLAGALGATTEAEFWAQAEAAGVVQQ